jgi:integrase
VKRPSLKVRPYQHSETHPWVLDLRAFGGKRQFYKTRAEADAERLRQVTLLERHGRDAIGLPQRELSDFITAKRELAKFGETINDAVKHRIDYLERVRRSGINVARLADKLIETKRKDGRSSSYVSDLKNRLGRFRHDFGERAVASINVEEVDNWFRDLPLSPKSRANFRANIGVLFSYAERLGIIDKNPVLRTAKPKLIDKPPEIFTVDELRSLLEAAQRAEPTVLPILAIGAFAGLRDAEIKRLEWSEVDLSRGYIEVKAAKAKSAQRRIITIQPNLTVWLRPYAAMEGAVVPEGARNRLERVRKAARIADWPKNGLRHSFASYRLAATHDAPRVASELGHTSPQMLYSTYRELVLPEEAERYWKIAPLSDILNVISISAKV